MSGSSVQTETLPPKNIKNIRFYTQYTKRYTTGIMVWCFVVGTNLKKNAFEVEGHAGMSISKLREVIYERKKNNFKDKGFDSCDLNLWKVDIPSDTTNIKLETLQSRSHDMDKEDITIKELGGEELTPFNDFGDIFKSDSKNIRIIVQPPFSAGQGYTDVSRDIVTLGYLPRQGGLGGTLLPTDLKVRSTNEGVNLDDPDTNPRFDIIKPLVNELINKKVLLVRAPPFSGKTSTAQILEQALVNAPEFSTHRVIRISLLWKPNINWDTFGEKWKSIVGVSWEKWIDQCDKIPSILIVDEAQLIYGNKKVTGNDKETADQFWTVIKSLLQEVTGINIIMFAAYGYRSSNHTGLSTPVKLPRKYCKSLIDINFSSSELKTYVDKFCSNYFKLDQQSILELYKYIQTVTEGHAGLVRHILVSIEDAMKKRINTNCLTWEAIFKYLNSKDFNSSIYINCRAVPDVSSLKENEKRLGLCEDAYLKGKVPFSIDNPDPDALYLVKIGTLMVVDDKYLTFAAPLLKRSFFQQNYGVENSIDITPTDLHHFIVKIFTAMCNEISGKILRETLGFGSDGRILEQTWQKEFYRIGTQVLGRDHFLSCEVGSVFGCEGKIDFYVDELEWAIELLRDGEDMEEHKARFEPSKGEYKEIVKYAKSIAIVDIRSIGIIDTRSEAKNVRKMKADFIYVSCSKDFDAFKIESLGKETVTISFQD